jgi:2-desacetyl-2-hydroxyethyl bacteriochlorophyllide A dehydrogenase
MNMQTLICTQPGQLDHVEQPMPVVLPGETLLRVRRVGVCGTDLHAFEGTQPYFNYPRILGHELAAEVVETDHKQFTTGDLVTVIPYYACGRCIACRNHQPNCCTQLQVCGVHTDGGMREYFAVPSNALMAAGGLDMEALALVEPLAIGAHAIRRAMIQPGETMLVIGAGPIGLGIILFAKITGARILVMDVQENRLQYCREMIGITETIHAIAVDPVAAVRELTNGDMASVVIDATGNRAAINKGFEYLAHGGRYVLVGLQKGMIEVLHPEFHKREATLMSSRNATRDDFEWVMEAIRTGQVNPLSFITHRVGLSEAAKAFPAWLEPDAGVIKAMILV